MQTSLRVACQTFIQSHTYSHVQNNRIYIIKLRLAWQRHSYTARQLMAVKGIYNEWTRSNYNGHQHQQINQFNLKLNVTLIIQCKPQRLI